MKSQVSGRKRARGRCECEREREHASVTASERVGGRGGHASPEHVLVHEGVDGKAEGERVQHVAEVLHCQLVVLERFALVRLLVVELL